MTKWTIKDLREEAGDVVDIAGKALKEEKYGQAIVICMSYLQTNKIHKNDIKNFKEPDIIRQLDAITCIYNIINADKRKRNKKEVMKKWLTKFNNVIKNFEKPAKSKTR